MQLSVVLPLNGTQVKIKDELAESVSWNEVLFTDAAGSQSKVSFSVNGNSMVFDTHGNHGLYQVFVTDKNGMGDNLFVRWK